MGRKPGLKKVKKEKPTHRHFTLHRGGAYTVQGLPGPRMRDSAPPPLSLSVAPAVGTLEAWVFPLRPHRTTNPKVHNRASGALCLSPRPLSATLVGPGLGDGWVRWLWIRVGGLPPPPGPPPTPNVPLPRSSSTSKGEWRGGGMERIGTQREEKREERGGRAVEGPLPTSVIGLIFIYEFIHPENGKCTVQPSSRSQPVR